MIHVLDILCTDDEGDWLVVGKGVSYNEQAVQNWKGKVCYLNDTNKGLRKGDLTVCNDWPVLPRLSPHSTRLIATSTGQHEGTPWTQRTILAYQRYMHAMNYISQFGTLSFFDIRTNPIREFPSHPVCQTYVSSAETAFWILGEKGVTDITTTGVDCSRDYHSNFPPDKPRGDEFVHLERLLMDLCTKYAITWSKI